MEYVPRYKFAAALQINCDQFSGKLSSKKTRNDYLTTLKPIIIKYLSDPMYPKSTVTVPPAAKNPFEKGFLSVKHSQNFLIGRVWGNSFFFVTLCVPLWLKTDGGFRESALLVVEGKICYNNLYETRDDLFQWRSPPIAAFAERLLGSIRPLLGHL
jgi:hypothetical protein